MYIIECGKKFRARDATELGVVDSIKRISLLWAIRDVPGSCSGEAFNPILTASFFYFVRAPS